MKNKICKKNKKMNKYSLLLSSFYFPITIIGASTIGVSIIQNLNVTNENIELIQVGDNIFNKDDPIDNFKQNVDLNHKKLLDEYLIGQQINPKMEYYDIGFMTNNGGNVYGVDHNSSHVPNPIQLKTATLNFNKNNRQFTTSKHLASSQDSYVIGTPKEMPNLNTNVVSDIDKFITFSSQTPTGQGWLDGDKYWHSSKNSDEEALSKLNQLQTLSDYWRFLIKYYNSNQKDWPFYDINFSLFSDTLSNIFTSDMVNNPNTNFIKANKKFKGLGREYDTDHDDESLQMKYSSLNKLMFNHCSFSSATKFLNIMSYYTDYPTGSGDSNSWHMFALRNGSENFSYKIKSYDLANIFALTDFGADLNQETSDFNYWIKLGLNENYFLAAEGILLNKDVEENFKLENPDSWFDPKDFTTVDNRPELMDYICSKIFKRDSFKNEKIDENLKISYDNIDKIRAEIYQTQHMKMIDINTAGELLTTSEIDKIINKNKNNGWSDYCKEYGIKNHEIYDQLLLILPFLKYSNKLLVADNSESPDIWNNKNKTSNPLTGYNLLETFLDDENKLILGEDTLVGNRSFRTSSKIDNVINFNEKISIDEWDGGNNVEIDNSGSNIFGTGLTLKHDYDKDKNKYSYWYMPQNDLEKVYDMTNNREVKSVAFTIEDEYKDMLPTEAFEKAYSLTSDVYQIQNTFKKMFYDKNHEQTPHIGVSPFERVDLYGNYLFIPDEYWDYDLNNYTGKMTVRVVNRETGKQKSTVISGFKALAQPVVSIHMAIKQIGIVSPETVMNEVYKIAIDNCYPGTYATIKSTSETILGISIIQEPIQTKSLTTGLVNLVIDYKLLPLKAGKAEIEIELFDQDDTPIFKNPIKSNSVAVGETYIPEKTPVIVPTNFINTIKIDTLKTTDERIYEFEVNNPVVDSIYEIKADDYSLISIIYMNETHTKFQIKCLTDQVQDTLITIFVRDKNYKEELIYLQKQIQIEIVDSSITPIDPIDPVDPTEPIDGLSIGMIVGIVIGSVLGVGILGCTGYFVIKNRNRRIK